MTGKTKITYFKAAIWAIGLLCVILSQPALSATGTINYNTTYQQLEGFGGAAAYDCANLTNHQDSEEIYDLLFKDLGLEILRIRNTYGYPDSGSNLNATAAIVAEATEPQRSPNIMIELVPWSPAAYLKSNNSVNGGNDATLAGGPSNYVYSSYANWWYDSLVAWAAQSVYPDFISIQNEPDWDADYDSCRFNATESTTVAGYDKAFEAVYNKLNTEMGSSMPQMWAPCTMGFGNSIPYIAALVSRGQINNVSGFSHHLYSDGSYDSPDGMISEMQIYQTNYGYKPLHMTEYVKLNTTPDFDMAWKFAWHIYNSLYYEKVTSFFNWTLFRGPSSNAGGIVSMTSTTDYVIRPQYWFLKGYTYFTDKDWFVVDASVAGTDASNLRMSAFKNPQADELTIVILNISTSSVSLSLTVNNFTPTYSEVYRSSGTENWVPLGSYSPSMTIPGRSITTIHFLYREILSVSSGDGGTVTTPGEGDFGYITDTNAVIAATPDRFYHFSHWTGSAATAGKVADPCDANTTVFMDDNYSVVANFELDPADTTPPEPNPMEWEVVPTAAGSTTIIMTAATATDANSGPVQYYFECTNDATKSSTWQDSKTHIAYDLSPLTEYSFKVKARDSYLTPNETEWSSTESVTTQAPSTTVTLLGSWQAGLNHNAEAGTDRALIFIAHAEFTSTKIITSVTYGGQEMTKVMEQISETTTRAYAAAFILPEYGIATASGSDFVVTWSSAPSYALYSSSFFAGANQTNSIGATAYNWTTSLSVLTSPLATNDGDMVILGATNGSSGSYITNNGFTEGTDQATSGQMTGVTGYKAAAGIEETPSVTFTGSTSRQLIIGFVLQAPIYTDNPPAAPTGLTAMAGNDTVSLDWNDNGELDLAGYNVYRSATQGNGYGKINSSIVTDSNYVDNNVNNGTPYYYVVTAVDAIDQESGYSNEASATPDFQTCEDVKAGGYGFISDINGDCYVDVNDLAVIVQYWLHNDCAGLSNCDGADLEPDGDVDFMDFDDFALDWLNCNNPADINCIANW